MKVENVILTLEVFDYLKEELNKELSTINGVIKKYESNNQLRGIVFGDYRVIGVYPAITIQGASRDIGWFATSATQSRVVNLVIMCLINNLAREATERYIIEFSEIIERILTHPKRLQFSTPSGVVWDSFIERVEFGTIKGGSIKASRLLYNAKCIVPIGIK